MEKYNYQTLKETLYYEKMSNGLEVYLLKKKGFSKTYGIFATEFGSIDTTFIPLNETKMIKVPDGVAHFLEHKMFEMKEGDASDLFSQLGASTNAFTSSSRTAYLFSTSANEIECTKLLLDFVQELYLTDKSIEKEKGIICQEIQMYDDDPDWQNYFGAIKNLYHNHPIAIDIAGTCESVRETTKDDLEKCYHTFYHPSNMVLFVVGNIEPEQLMPIIVENQQKKHFEISKEIIRQSIDEPQSIKNKRAVTHMDVIMPKLTVSIKCPKASNNPQHKIKRELACNLLLDLYFTKSASTYNNWLESGLINDTFGAFFMQERDYAFIQIGGDTTKPEQLEEKIYTFIRTLKDSNLNEEDFTRLKRKTMGNFIVMFNSPESIANLFIKYHFENISAFRLIEELNNVCFQDILDVRQLFNESLTSTHLVLPLE